MLILIGPGFKATEPRLQRLAQLTGLVVYDLKTKLRPGCWGVLRVLADVEQARDLTGQLQKEAFPAVLVDAEVSHDPARRIVAVDRLTLSGDSLLLELSGQSMPVPFKGLSSIVTGEVHVRSERGTSAASSGNAYRAVVPTIQDIQAFRENQVVTSYDAYHVADLHFATVLWVARLDARRTDCTALGDFAGSPAQRLDQVVDKIARLTSVRVDAAVRTSSLASFATRPPPMRSASPAPGSPVSAQERRQAPSDPRFDGYSRLVAQAEREALALLQPSETIADP